MEVLPLHRNMEKAQYLPSLSQGNNLITSQILGFINQTNSHGLREHTFRISRWQNGNNYQ